jgi:hypothetical protein
VDHVAVRLEHVDLLDGLDRLDVELLKGRLQPPVVASATLSLAARVLRTPPAASAVDGGVSTRYVAWSPWLSAWISPH